MRSARFAVIAALALGLLAGTAQAWTHPTRAQRQAITSAVLRAIPPSTRPKIEVRGIRVTSVRLFGISPAPFASANEVPKPPFRDSVQPQVFVVQRVPTATDAWRWIVVSYGTSGVGCGVVPLPYLRDLTGDRTPCPG